VRLLDTLRSRVLLLVVGVGLVPFALLAIWLTIGTARGGEQMLRARLQADLQEHDRQISVRWSEQRYAILFLAESSDVQEELRRAPRADWQSARLPELFAELPPSVHAVRVTDLAGRLRWEARRPGSPAVRTIDVDQRITATVDGVPLGVLRVTLELEGLLAQQERTVSGLDAVLAVVDRVSGRSLLPLPFAPAALESDHFDWGEDEWVAERRVLQEPPLTLIAAAPITILSRPFRQAATRGTVGLALIAVASIIAAAMLSRRLTRSLETLGDAATAVAQGDLDHTVAVAGTAELRSVAAGLNAMTANLRQSLALAAQREALAAVGSFAAEMAHEIRNPLGAMRLDLELVEEQLPAGSQLRAQQRGAIREVERLGQVVSGALDLARSGSLPRAPLDIADPLRAAVHYAAPRFEQRGGRISLALPTRTVLVSGDQHSLQRLFLNLLLNAADAVPDRGHCDVLLEARDQHALVRFTDNGRGMDPDTLARATEAFFSTTPGGNGLGLAVAARIAKAHGGTLRIASAAGAGTTIELLLPLV
jgi:signal transduction histidine kinase